MLNQQLAGGGRFSYEHLAPAQPVSASSSCIHTLPDTASAEHPHTPFPTLASAGMAGGAACSSSHCLPAPCQPCLH